MKNKLAILLILLNLQIIAQVQFVENGYTSGKNVLSIGTGFTFLLKDELNINTWADKQIRYLSTDLRYGISDNVDVIINWRGIVKTNLFISGRNYDWGDLRIKTKFLFVSEQNNIPAIGLLSSIKLPNSVYTPTKVGSNETDFEFALIFSKSIKNVKYSVNIGSFINGDPNYLAYQYDLMVYGLNIEYQKDNFLIFAESYGTYGKKHMLRKTQIKIGTSYSFGGFKPCLAVNFRVLGNNIDYAPIFENSEDFGINFSLSKSFNLFMN